MTKPIGMRAFSVLFTIFLVSIAFMPVVSAQSIEDGTQCLGPTFTDPNELIRTITIDNHTLEEIINSLPEPDPSQSPFFEYNYERFLIDTFNRMEFGFYFRENHYYIDYWDSNDKDPNWVPGWIFIAGYGSSEVLITDDSFDAFIDKVDLWMIDNEGKTLKEMFNNLYKPDGTGDVKLLSIYI